MPTDAVADSIILSSLDGLRLVQMVRHVSSPLLSMGKNKQNPSDLLYHQLAMIEDYPAGGGERI